LLRIPTKKPNEIPFHLEGGLKKVLINAQRNPDSTLTRAVLKAIWADRKTLLEVATSYAPSFWAIDSRSRYTKGKST
jgi:hypothetical protein